MKLRVTRTNLSLTAIFLATCLGHPAAAAVLAKGRIYAGEAAMDTPLFLYENTKAEEGGKSISRTKYTDPQGKLLVEEEVVYEGGKLKVYRYNQLQTDEHGTVEVKDGKVNYTFVSAKGTAVDDEDWKDGMAVPDGIHEQIEKNWETLAAGDSAKFRFLVLEAQDDFGFKIFKDGESQFQGKPAINLVMKASGFFVALAAPAFKITVEKEASHRILKMDGRLPVRIAKRTPPQSRGDLRALDGVLVLDYSEIASGAAAGSSAGTGSGAGAGAATGSPASGKGAGGRGAKSSKP